MPIKQRDNQTGEQSGRQAWQLDVAERNCIFAVVMTQ
jgi:hypothetical protein